MARPLRIEFPNALYHITSRGDRREAIYRDDEDRRQWLMILGQVCECFNWVIHGYCQMTNHYHLLAETIDGNLSRGMRQLNGLYTQKFNNRYKESGHLFQGRFKAIIVQKESYLLELARYVVLNPVRAKMVNLPEDWAWSSYRAMCNLEAAKPWLDVDWTLSQFGTDRTKAIASFRQFVWQGKGLADPKIQVKNQLFLGSDSFISLHRQDIDKSEKLSAISKAHKRSIALPLSDYQSNYFSRDEAMAKAYLSGAYTMAEIARHFNVHYMTVSRALKK
ncbi:MAG: transposase [Methylomonas sp.]|jgi:REP element-mobilizing transposase RayT